jgi:hypothetical protein
VIWLIAQDGAWVFSPTVAVAVMSEANLLVGGAGDPAGARHLSRAWWPRHALRPAQQHVTVRQ